MQKITSRFTGGMTFQTELENHQIIIDTKEEDGGNDLGPRPKQLMLVSLAGCTGLDVVSTLNKMRIAYNNFEIDVEATQTEEYPKIYNWVKVTYRISVSEEDQSKIEKAVQLSQEKYCGVSEMFRKFCTLEHAIVYR